MYIHMYKATQIIFRSLTSVSQSRVYSVVKLLKHQIGEMETSHYNMMQNQSAEYLNTVRYVFKRIAYYFHSYLSKKLNVQFLFFKNEYYTCLGVHIFILIVI